MVVNHDGRRRDEHTERQSDTEIGRRWAVTGQADQENKKRDGWSEGVRKGGGYGWMDVCGWCVSGVCVWHVWGTGARGTGGEESLDKLHQ